MTTTKEIFKQCYNSNKSRTGRLRYNNRWIIQWLHHNTAMFVRLKVHEQVIAKCNEVWVQQMSIDLQTLSNEGMQSYNRENNISLWAGSEGCSLWRQTNSRPRRNSPCNPTFSHSFFMFMTSKFQRNTWCQGQPYRSNNLTKSQVHSEEKRLLRIITDKKVKVTRQP